ncbi:hypothetical protein KHQ81_15585 (plasmid) [Mycoplasmatota bacterium]|nr:hypothetical protein KHQ81_15585 [Mycoplasmatota bacterium]
MIKKLTEIQLNKMYDKVSLSEIDEIRHSEIYDVKTEIMGYEIKDSLLRKTLVDFGMGQYVFLNTTINDIANQIMLTCRDQIEDGAFDWFENEENNIVVKKFIERLRIIVKRFFLAYDIDEWLAKERVRKAMQSKEKLNFVRKIRLPVDVSQ